MKKNSPTMWILAVSFVLAALGFLLPFWPLSLLGIAILALSGRPVFAVAIGLLLDIAYGAPIGRYHFLYVPFTLFAAVLVVARAFVLRYVRKSPIDTI